ncbi:SusC/RagA family TonB-linked outer membrane protein [Flavivirga spongiicola]|uniref:TonB-dependent receptor n=1 Tax=Flavivirga spongiicola TaxID=421621 RepID=A0ABU7XWU8_9FLAO|nr:TonB-dependent receptor [Flavivirga sp. MEBiC05379]MDO5980260.1 TonB-dependent receptor [Flavivirga sp. MEBiC05379]
MKKNLRSILMILFLVSCWTTYGQDKTINGIVTDKYDQPLPGASVLVKGTTNGAQTDFDGKFTLTTNGNTILIVSYLGFVTKEVSVDRQTQITIKLEEDISNLDQVVVVGYGAVKKSDLTGSVSSVKAEDINAVPVSSLDQALQGRASGVSVVQNSGIPGAPTTIRIRGTNSIQGGNKPLVIVDGFPVVGGLDGINPADVENIEILKDASSTAIYGARGTNGVIIVTTKKGKEGKFSVDFDSYYGIQEQSEKIDLLNAQQFIEIANKRAVNDGEATLFFPDPSAITADTDWIGELFDASPVQSHTVTFTAGNDRVKTSQSFNYFNQDGILKNSGFERATLRNNTEAKMNDWLTISNSLILSRSDRQFSGDGGNRAVIEAHLAPPTVPVYDENGDYSVVNAYPFSPGALDNPMKWINEYDDEILSTRIFDNFYGLFTITPHLTFKSSIGVDYTTRHTSRYLSRLLLDGAPGGKAFRGASESYSLLNENILNYNKEFGDHKVDAILGYNWQTFKSTFISAASYDFVTDLLGSEVLQDGSSPQPSSSGGSEWGIASVLGRINYSYKDKYLFTVTARSDWSSRFAKGNQRATFPSAAFAWKVSKEDFMDNADWVSNLKFRASWGKTGNQAVSPFQTWAKVGSTLAVLGGELGVGFVPGTPANPNLKWETTDQFDIGVDFGILKNRVRFTFDYYYKKTTDLLARVDLPSSVGFNSITQNIGEMENKGIEFNVDANIANNEDFSWDTTFQISRNRNEITKLARGADVFPPRVNNLISSFHILREGLPISMFYGFVNDGYDANGQNQYLDFASTDSNGDIVMEPDGQITDADQRVIGNPHPDYTFGFGNTFKYKNFTLNVFLEGAQGFDLVWGTKFQLRNSFFRGGNQLTDVLNHWTPTNTNPSSPVISSNNLFRGSTEFIEDGSYIKIRTINLAYNIPTDKVSWLNNAQVYVNAQNMFTFTKYSGYDPEVSGYADGDLRLGVDNNVYPSTKVISMGLRLGI